MGKSLLVSGSFSDVFNGTYAVFVELQNNDGVVIARERSEPVTVTGAIAPPEAVPGTVSVTVS
jgi:hypothetical protein